MRQGRYIWVDGKPVYQGTKAATSVWEVVGVVVVTLFAAFCYWVA